MTDSHLPVLERRSEDPDGLESAVGRRGGARIATRMMHNATIETANGGRFFERGDGCTPRR